MSRTFYYRQVLPEPEGEYVELALGVKIWEYVDHEWADGPVVVHKGDRVHAFIEGLAASGTMEGAQELADAIDHLKDVEIYVRY